MILHTVAFRLKHPANSAEEAGFLRAAAELEAIEGVRNFQCLRQTSSKNTFTFGLSMEFSNDAEYEHYNSHPLHMSFVRERWLPEVVEFLELDYEPMS